MSELMFILSDLAVKPPTSGGGFTAIINYWNLMIFNDKM